MNAVSRFLLVTLAVAAAFILVINGDRALHAAVPKDMPTNAQFLATGFDISHNEQQGNWVSCNVDSAQDTNWCRVTDTHGNVVFEGDYLPLATAQPLAQAQLKVARVKAQNMWVEGPAEQQPVPVISLQDGNVLVPAADRDALAARWSAQPEEFERVSEVAPQ